MRRRDDGDRLPCDVNTVLAAGLVDRRKSYLRVHRQRRQIEQHVLTSALQHLLVNGPRQNVSGGQGPIRVIRGHELVAVPCAQDSALSPNRLGNQEALRVAMIERSGMKLDVFRVNDGGAGTVGHGKAICPSHPRIRRMQIELADSARGEHCM